MTRQPPTGGVDFGWALVVPCPTCDASTNHFCRSRKNHDDLYAPTFWVHVSRRNLAKMVEDNEALGAKVAQRPDQIIALYLTGAAGTKLTMAMVTDISACVTILSKWGEVQTS